MTTCRALSLLTGPEVADWRNSTRAPVAQTKPVSLARNEVTAARALLQVLLGEEVDLTGAAKSVRQMTARLTVLAPLLGQVQLMPCPDCGGTFYALETCGLIVCPHCNMGLTRPHRKAAK